MIKKLLATAMLLIGTAVFAQLPRPIVVVKIFDQTELITQGEFEEKVAILERQAQKTMTRAEKLQLMEVLIADILLEKAAIDKGITISDSQIIQMGKAQFGLNITDQEFKDLIEEQTGVDWEAYAENARKSLLQQQYIMQFSGFDSADAAVTTDEIEEYYRRNEAEFINPNLIRISHVFFNTTNTESTESEVRERASTVLTQLQNAEITFEEAVRLNSGTNLGAIGNGDLGFIPLNDERLTQIFGSNFLNAVFDLSKGQLSDVLKSNVGFHIVRVTDSIDRKFLELDDPIYPGQTTTVRQYIAEQMSGAKTQGAYQIALSTTVAELTDQAEIQNFFEDIYPE